MAKRKKSGRLTLRMDPEIHARVDKTAQALGMDINGLLNVMIRESLPRYEVLSSVITGETRVAAPLLYRWVQFHPGGHIQEFVSDVITLERGQKSILFPNGKWYCLNAEGNDFVETEPFWHLEQPQPQPLQETEGPPRAAVISRMVVAGDPQSTEEELN